MLLACGTPADEGSDAPETDAPTTDDTDAVPDTDAPEPSSGFLLHRLEASGWRRSVRDLLFLPALPEVALPAEPTLAAFDHLVDGLVLTTYHAELFDRAVFTVTDPLRDAAHPSWPSLATCDVGSDACRADVVGTFASRAWRRPVTEAERARLVAFVEAGIAEGIDARGALVDGLAAVLSSPNFLFRVERRGAIGETVDAWELAARLAAYLWKSVPDEPLRQAAASGALLQPATRAEQARRMLADPRADALVDDFAGQWLELRSVADARPEDPVLFPAFDLAVREQRKASVLADMRWHFDDALASDAPVADLLRGDQGLVDAPLAELYAMAPPADEGAVVSTLPLVRRGGLLTSAGWLIVTSKFVRTSPTRRGKWIVERLFCEPPSAPPAGVEGSPGGGQTSGGSFREQFEALTADPYCQACHVRTDPYGFAFGQFQHTGRFSPEDRGVPVDTRVTLPTGQTVTTANAVAAIIAEDPRVPGCFVRFATTYALGRPWPQAEVDAVVAEVEPLGAPIATTFERIAASPFFALRAPSEAE